MMAYHYSLGFSNDAEVLALADTMLQVSSRQNTLVSLKLPQN